MISPFNNLNRIDFILKESFGTENVEFEQKERRFQKGTTHDYIFTIKSNNMEIKMLVEASDDSSIKWSYYEDPTNENSKLINRNKVNLTSINEKLSEIFENKMFSKKYLDTIYESINESNIDEEEKTKEVFITSDEMNNQGEPLIEVYEENLEELLNHYGATIDSIQILDDSIFIQLSHKSHDGQIPTATRVSIETEFNSFDEVDMAWFSGNLFKMIMNGEPEIYSGSSSKQI